jgi:hypothetical protein
MAVTARRLCAYRGFKEKAERSEPICASAAT